jgi:hypothetical protein
MGGLVSVEDPAHEPVRLNIYDVGVSETMVTVNDVLSGLGTGIYHTAIEVYGREWSFAEIRDEYGNVMCCSGVTSALPCRDRYHCYRESVNLGCTRKSREQVRDVLEQMREDWQSESYDLFRNNCHTFCAHLCRQLAVKGIPDWVTSLARAGKNLDNNLAVGFNAAQLHSTASVASVQSAQVGYDVEEDYQPRHPIPLKQHPNSRIALLS